MTTNQAKEQSNNFAKNERRRIAEHGRLPALALMESIEKPAPEKAAIHVRITKLVGSIGEALWRTPDLNLAEWRRLEYRNEIPTREGERMNYFSIR